MIKSVLVWFAVVNLLLLACSATKPPAPNSVSGLSLVMKLSLEELVVQSDLIVVGIVTGQKSQWNAQHNQIHTLVTVNVEEWVRGEPKGDEIIIKISGGQVDEVSQVVEDAPSFRVGEKLLVFLQSQESDTVSVVGGWQGKLVIENDKIAGSDVSLAELIKQIKAQSSKSSG